MSTHNLCFYGEISKIIPPLSSITHLTSSTDARLKDHLPHSTKVPFLVSWLMWWYSLLNYFRITVIFLSQKMITHESMQVLTVKICLAFLLVLQLVRHSLHGRLAFLARWRQAFVVCRLSVRPSSFNIFKRHLLWSHEADSYQISHTASIDRGNE